MVHGDFVIFFIRSYIVFTHTHTHANYAFGTICCVFFFGRTCADGSRRICRSFRVAETWRKVSTFRLVLINPPPIATCTKKRKKTWHFILICLLFILFWFFLSHFFSALYDPIFKYLLITILKVTWKQFYVFFWLQIDRDFLFILFFSFVGE